MTQVGDWGILFTMVPRSHSPEWECIYRHINTPSLIDLLKTNNIKTILDQFEFYKKTHKKDRDFQLWQEGIQPKLITTEKMMIEKINYIHQNPVKRGYVDEAKYWRYSSARDYEGVQGLIEIEKMW